MTQTNGNLADELAGQLEAWAPMVASGYECPAASTAMFEAAKVLRTRPTPAPDVVEAASALLAQFDAYRESDLNHECAHRFLIRYELWDNLRASLSQSPDALVERLEEMGSSLSFDPHQAQALCAEAAATLRNLGGQP